MSDLSDPPPDPPPGASPLYLLLALHAVVGLGVLLYRRALGRRAFLIALVAPLAAAVWAGAHAAEVIDGGVISTTVTWVPGLGLGLDLRFDGFTLLMVGLVSGIGTLVFAYGYSYFADSSRAAQVAGLLTLFAGAMLGLVLADDLLMLFICWELTSITSYLLIGNDDRDPQARAAALQALLITGAGGLVMLGGFVILGQQGSYQISELVADPPSGTLTSVALVLVLIGAFAKSAQYPFHSWLPGAMIAPTPISAYLHSAAMVKAGVYLVALLAPAFAPMGLWRTLVVTVGLVTMIAGGLRALRPLDLKQLLAHGTVSQLGFMMVLFGVGHPEATAAGCAVIVAHGLFKASLFMVVGIVDHQSHTRDLREIPHFGDGWTPTKVVAVISAASMAAIPPLAGFWAKEKAYEAFFDGSTADRWVLVGLVAGSVLTVAYSLRLLVGILRPELVVGPAEREPVAPARPPALAFLAPTALLAAVTTAVGLAPVLWNDFLDAAASSIDAEAKVDIHLWPGFTAVLGLSALTLALGVGLFLLRRPVASFQARFGDMPNGSQIYNNVVRSLTRTAGAVTQVAQPGSLPVYLTVILLTTALAPGLALLLGAFWPGWPEAVTTWADLPVVALLGVAAVASTVTAGRFAAALMLGAAGYGMALLFVIQGAPDLALTQFCVETLSVVIFLLVLRRLPDRFERRTPAIGRAVRLGVSGLVAAFMFVMAIAASGARVAPPVSQEMVSRSLSEAGGRNVVNVILVDFRGFDTVGEITVLVAAAIGATALARAGRSRRRTTTRPEPEQVSSR